MQKNSKGQLTNLLKQKPSNFKWLLKLTFTDF